MHDMENNVAFLCTDVARLLRKRFDDIARQSGSTGAQWRALLILKHSPGINQGALAERLEVEPITACRMVDRLEQAGMAERRRDPNDRRVWQLFLCKAAEPVLAELHEVGGDVIKAATEGLNEAEIQELTRLLNIIRDNASLMEPQTAVEKIQNG